MSINKQIRFGTTLHSANGNMSEWRHSEATVNASINFEFAKNIAIQAEQAKFDFVFVADGLYINEKSVPHFLNRFEPISLLSALASVTQHIGLVGTVSTSYSEPFTISRQFASLDHLSGGRAGWNVVTTPLEGTAKNHTRKQHPEHGLRYEIADEYLQVAKGLWDSWGKDAFVRNQHTGQFFDPTKLHTLNHKGKHFEVAGPLNIERTPQERPIIFQAGASGAGRNLAVKHADAIFAHHDSFEEAQKFYQDVKQQLIDHGRKTDDLLIFQGIGVLVGDSAEDVERQYQAMAALVTMEDALNYLGRFFDHHDFSQYELDAPFPELGTLGENSFKSGTDAIKRKAKTRHLSLRQVALESATPRPPFAGTAEQVAKQLAFWVQEEATDGFIIAGADPTTLGRFIHQVIPLLQQRGLYRTEYPGTTLRSSLGLKNPQNQFEQTQQEFVDAVE